MIELVVYKYDDYDGAPYDIIPIRKKPSFLEELKGNGGGSFDIPLEAQVNLKPDTLEYRNLVKIKVNSVIVGAFLIGRQSDTTIAEGESAEAIRTIAGEGLKIWFDDAVLEPYGGLQAESGTKRAFNFASEMGTWYNPSNWITPYVFNTVHSSGNPWGVHPEEWPENAQNAQWIWGEPFSSSANLGTHYFRYTFTTASAGNYAVYAACDNYLSVWLNGEQLAVSDPKNWSAWHKALKVTFTLPAGTHVLAFTGSNALHPGFNPGAMVMTLMRVEGESENQIGRSGTGDWKVFPRPEAAPSWTAGEVMLSLLAEAAADGVVFADLVTPTFTATLDSNGDPWELGLDWVFDVGESYLSILAKMEELVCDAWINPDTMEFNMVSRRGNDRSVQPTTPLVTTRINLLNTTSFENSANIWAATGLPTNTVSYPADGTQMFGTRYARRTMTVAGSSIAGGMQIDVPIGDFDRGEVYTESIYVRFNAAQRIRARAANVSGTSYIVDNIVDVPANTWTRIPVEFTPPTAAANPSITAIRFSIIAVSGGSGHIWQIGNTFDLDGALLEKGTLKPWFDGDSPDTATVIYTWASTQYASDSIESTTTLIPDPSAPVIKFEKGRNLRRAQSEGVGNMKNDLLVRTETGWLIDASTQDAASKAKYGTLRAKLDTNASVDVSKALVGVVFATQSEAEEGASYDITSFEFIPWQDFSLGDWVLAPDRQGILVKRRIVSIALEESDAGLALYTVEFDTIFRDSEDRMNRFMGKAGGGSLGSSYSNAGATPPNAGAPIIIPPGVPLTLFPSAPGTLTITSTGRWTSDGMQAVSDVDINWADVTTNTDGSATVPAFYEVWGYPTAEPGSLALLAVVTTSDATVLGLPYGAQWKFKVRAFNDAATSGDFSTEFTHTPVGPTSPMAAPEAPTLATSFGLARVTWNGELSGSIQPPPQFRYTYAEAKTTAGSTWARVGNAFSRGGGTINVAGLVVGTSYDFRLKAVDGLGIESAVSPIATIIVTGIDLDDLDASIGEAIEAAEDAAHDARASLNLLEDAGFELNTEDYWDWDNVQVTNVTTAPRSGLRHIRIATKTTTFTAVTYKRAIPCNPGDIIQLRMYVRVVDTGTEDFTDNGLYLGVNWSAVEAMTSATSVDVNATQNLLTTGYTLVVANWTVPSGARWFLPRINVIDISNNNIYYVDDIRVLQITDSVTLFDGSVIAEKIAAGAVSAEKIAANSIAATHIQAEAVTAGKVAANAIAANNIQAAAIAANHIQAGAIQVNHLSPTVGGELDLSANDSINLVVGMIDEVEGTANATQQDLHSMQTYYTFGPTGAVVSTPSSPFAVAIRNDRIEMLENGNPVSYWNSGQMVVPQLVGERVILGNHQLEKYTDGTVVRAL